MSDLTPEQMRKLCVPLCGASKAYDKYDKPWLHEAQCPVRIEWQAKRQAAATPEEES